MKNNNLTLNPGNSFLTAAIKTFCLIVLLMTSVSAATITVLNTNDSRGNLRTVSTGSFGKYSFTDVEIGETYVLLVRSKNFRSTPQVITITNDLTELNLNEDGGEKHLKSKKK